MQYLSFLLSLLTIRVSVANSLPISNDDDTLLDSQGKHVQDVVGDERVLVGTGDLGDLPSVNTSLEHSAAISIPTCI